MISRTLATSDIYGTGLSAARRPLLITFSGIDGAGKTTQIDRLSARLTAQGYRVARFTFWDDVAILARVRADFGDAAPSRAAPSRVPKLRPKNNKSRRLWYLSAARAGFYTMDLARLRRLLARIQKSPYDFAIFDRYIYDQLANIYSHRLMSRAYSRLLLSLTPRPDLSFVLDASASHAFIRKPEYPLDFMHRYRRTFLTLREVAPNLIVIPPAEVDEVEEQILEHVSQLPLTTVWNRGGLEFV